MHTAYSKLIKKKNKPRRELKRCTEYLLSMLSRSIRTTLSLIGRTTTDKFMLLKRRDRELLLTIMKMYHQQKSMFDAGVHQCEGRIVSIYQPHVRPIVRGKARAKLSDTGESWCAACYFAKNVIKFLKGLLHALFELVNHCWNLVIETEKSATFVDYRMLCVDVVNT